MKKAIVLLILALLLCAGVALAEPQGILSKPFPDFTVTDTEGNAFTLSEVLRDHDAVVINLWATWCGYCEKDFPDLEKAYQAYGDRVAFIALSGYANDTMADIAAYRKSHGISFRMGSDNGVGLCDYTNCSGFPTTVVVDRFGNAAFMQSGAFLSPTPLHRVLDAVLAENYTETRAMEKVPAAVSTAAYPVSARRALTVENENARRIRVTVSGEEAPFAVYAVNDDTARLRLFPGSADLPEETILYVLSSQKILYLVDLLEEDQTFRYALAMPAAQQDWHADAVMMTRMDVEDENELIAYLISSDAYVEEFMEALHGEGLDVAWSYAEPETESAAERYTVHVVDQNGDPVPGVFLNICTDSKCMPVQSDENGVIAFDGEPDTYHWQLIAVPEGYGFDADFEMYTPAVYGEWLLRVRKD